MAMISAVVSDAVVFFFDRAAAGGKSKAKRKDGAQRGDNLFFHAVSSFGYVKYIIAETEKFVKRREFSFPSCQNEPIVIQ